MTTDEDTRKGKEKKRLRELEVNRHPDDHEVNESDDETHPLSPSSFYEHANWMAQEEVPDCDSPVTRRRFCGRSRAEREKISADVYDLKPFLLAGTGKHMCKLVPKLQLTRLRGYARDERVNKYYQHKEINEKLISITKYLPVLVRVGTKQLEKKHRALIREGSLKHAMSRC